MTASWALRFEALAPFDERAGTVDGGPIVLHTKRPCSAVATAQDCAIHSFLSVAARGGVGFRSGPGGNRLSYLIIEKMIDGTNG